MNLLFFLGTVYDLVDHWRKAAGVIKSEVRGNFLIVLKLFFIMGQYLCKVIGTGYKPGRRLLVLPDSRNPTL
jgi:hypothetical protein